MKLKLPDINLYIQKMNKLNNLHIISQKKFVHVPGLSLPCGGYPSTCVPIKDTTIRILATIIFIVTPDLSRSNHK